MIRSFLYTYRFSLALLAACVVSRLATTIFYIEDTDSLRFALSVLEYDITELRPHFPGYPIFSFIAWLFYQFTGNYAIAFSLIGGVSVFVIIHYLLKAAGWKLNSFQGQILAFLVFFNPLIWLMSNRYMPDLAGTAMVVWLGYLVMFKTDAGYRSRLLAFAGIGLLAGLRLSYLPFLFIPALYHLMVSRNKFQLTGSGIIGTLLWLVPLIWITGFWELIEVAVEQTKGHFTEFGGTIETQPEPGSRLVHLAQGVFADGMGMYWSGRHPLAGLVSLGMAIAAAVALTAISRNRPWGRAAYLVLASCGAYLIWIYLGQNIIYKSRHVLPLIPFLLLFLAFGFAGWLSNVSRWVVRSGYVFLVAYLAVTSWLVAQHKSPTAIARAYSYLNGQDTNRLHLLSIPLVNYYMSARTLNARFYSVKDSSARSAFDALPDSLDKYTIGDYPHLLDGNPRERNAFYHNPYVNRMWSEIELYRY